MSYFCYDQYDHNLKSFKESGYTAAELKRVIRDFIKILTRLHESGTYHGHIKYYNLVIRDRRGFLAGGVGPRVSRCSFLTNKRQEIDIVDPREHDVMSFARAIEECYPTSTHDPELDVLVQFLKLNKSMDTLTYHPYVLKPMKRREFFLRVRETLSVLGKLPPVGKSKLTPLGTLNKKYTKGMNNWVERMGKLQNAMIQNVLHNGGTYEENLSGFVRFCRNLYVHADRDQRISWIQHFNTLHSLLNQACPEYAVIVHNMCYQEFKSGGNIFI